MSALVAIACMICYAMSLNFRFVLIALAALALQFAQLLL
jgi:hypothetical protein